MNFREEPSVLVGLLEFPLVNEKVFSFLRFLVDSKCFLLVINMSPKTVCVDLSNTSQYLPSEGYLELSSGHFPQEMDEDLSKNVTSDISSCSCEDKHLPRQNSSSASSESHQQVKISLKNIHLQSKEAVVISFIGGAKAK